MRKLLAMLALSVAAFGQNKITIIPTASDTGKIDFREPLSAGSNAATLKGPLSASSPFGVRFWGDPPSSSGQCAQSGVAVGVDWPLVWGSCAGGLPITNTITYATSHHIPTGIVNPSGLPAISMGVNDALFGTVDTAYDGAFLQFDARGVGTAPLFAIHGTPAGGAIKLLMGLEVDGSMHLDTGSLAVDNPAQVVAGEKFFVRGVSRIEDYIGHSALNEVLLQANLEIDQNSSDSGGFRSIVKVIGGTLDATRAGEFHVLRFASGGSTPGPAVTWGIELGLHADIAPTANSQENIGIYLASSHTGWVTTGFRNNIGVLVTGEDGWEFPYMARDTTGANLFYVDQHGSTWAKYGTLAGAGQATASTGGGGFAPGGLPGGSMFLIDSGGLAGDGGALAIGNANGLFGAIKGMLTNGTGPMGDISLQSRNTPTDTAFTEVARVSGVDLTLYARNLNVSFPSAGGAVTTVQELFMLDRTVAGTPHWKIDAAAGTSNSSLCIADQSGACVLQMDRIFLTAPQKIAYLDSDFNPKVTNTYSLGTSASAGLRWNAKLHNVDIDGTLTGTGVDCTAGTGALGLNECFTVNGNAFGFDAALGTVDNFALQFKTHNFLRGELRNDGTWNFGGTGSAIASGFIAQTSGGHAVVGTGQATNAFNPTGALGGTIYLKDTGVAANNGGVAMFGSAAGPYFAIKGLLTNGTGPLGTLSFEGRATSAATTFSEVMRLDATNTTAYLTNLNVSGTSSFGALTVSGAGQATNAFDPSGALGGSVFLQDTGGGANNGGAAIFGNANGQFFAIKGLLTNGTGPTGNLSFEGRASSGATVFTEIAHLDATTNTFYANNANFSPIGGSGAVTTVQHVFFLDRTSASTAHWNIDAASGTSNSSMCIADQSGACVLQMDRIFLTAVQKITTIDSDFNPKVTNTYSLGTSASSGLRWNAKLHNVDIDGTLTGIGVDCTMGTGALGLNECFTVNGNSFGFDAALGTIDNFALQFKTHNLLRGAFASGGGLLVYGTLWNSLDSTGGLRSTKSAYVGFPNTFDPASNQYSISGQLANASGNTVQIETDGNATLFVADTYSSAPAAGFKARSSRGSQTSPSPVMSGDNIASFTGHGATSTAVNAGTLFTTAGNAAILMQASENFSGSANGTQIVFQTTLNGTTTRATALTIGNDGGLTVAQGISAGNSISTTGSVLGQTSLVTFGNVQTGTSLFTLHTVIDNAQNGTFHNVNITGTCTGCGSGSTFTSITAASQYSGDIGSTGAPFNNIFGSTINATNSSGITRAQISQSGTLNLRDAGGSTVVTINSSSTTINGNVGLDGLFTCPAGQHFNSLNIAHGIVYNYSCS